MGYWWNIAEDASVGSVVGTVSATDADGDEVSYALTSGTEYFAVDSLSGEITLVAALDYETSQYVSFGISATDTYGNTATSWGDVSVTDVNESPVFNDDWGMGYWWSLSEDAAVGATVGTVSATDPQGDSVSYELTSGTETFAIDATTGEITLIAALDYETSQYASFGVKATDTEGNYSTSWGDVSVTDVAEAPIFTGGEMGYWWTVSEATAIGTVIGTVSANDPQAGSVTYEITSGSDTFSVDAISGEITLIAPLDYETSEFASFGVKATDADGYFATSWGEIYVEDAAEASGSGYGSGSGSASSSVSGGGSGSSSGNTSSGSGSGSSSSSSSSSGSSSGSGSNSTPVFTNGEEGYWWTVVEDTSDISLL